ncbi:MAG: hypothetical protein OXI51_13810 [Chloroflexota bacterium]|nr:hypothetical protein [Chloroflexota bacterium]
MTRPRKALFLLDQDFPNPSIPDLPDIDLRPLRDVHPDLIRDHEDWEVLREIRRRGVADGLITLDAGMLNQAKEMVVLRQTRLTLVVFRGTNNDPFVAAGLLMIHAPQIVRQLDRRRAQLWVLNKPSATPDSLWTRIGELARHESLSADALIRRERIAPINRLT